MCIYLFIELLFVFLFFFEKKRNSKTFLYTSSAVFFVLIAFHNGIFLNDIPHYVNFFLGKPSMYGTVHNPGDSLEPGFIFYCKFLHLLGIDNRFLFIFISGIIFFLPCLYLILKYSKTCSIPYLLIMTANGTASFSTFFGAYRQMLSLSLVFSALIIYINRDKIEKRWLLLIPLLCLCSILTHSSNYFIIPLLIFIIVTPLSKKIMYVMLIISLIVGSSLPSLDLNFVGNFFGTFNEVERTMTYIINDVYENLDVSFINLFPLTLIVILFVHFSTDEERKSMFLKFLVYGVSLKSFLGFFPLIDRFCFPLFILGYIGGAPEFIKCNKKAKIIIAILLLYFVWRASVRYSTAGYYLLPYNFIWE